MANKTKRWGVYAWTHTTEGDTLARINNTYPSEAEAIEASKALEFYGYESRVVVPEEFFGHAWAMIGANIEPEEGGANV